MTPPPGEAKVLHIGGQIAAALEYLHPTIVHRDLKPANVLINNPDEDFPVVKLTDFGLSRLRAATTLATLHPEAGTPNYLAPECYDTSQRTVLHQSDMYSLGVLIWAMLTGARPWQGCSIAAVAYKVAVLGERPPLEQLSKRRCPPRLRQLVRQCWDVDPLRRPAAAEAAKELGAMLRLHLEARPLAKTLSYGASGGLSAALGPGGAGGGSRRSLWTVAAKTDSGVMADGQSPEVVPELIVPAGGADPHGPPAAQGRAAGGAAPRADAAAGPGAAAAEMAPAGGSKAAKAAAATGAATAGAAMPAAESVTGWVRATTAAAAAAAAENLRAGVAPLAASVVPPPPAEFGGVPPDAHVLTTAHRPPGSSGGDPAEIESPFFVAAGSQRDTVGSPLVRAAGSLPRRGASSGGGYGAAMAAGPAAVAAAAATAALAAVAPRGSVGGGRGHAYEARPPATATSGISPSSCSSSSVGTLSYGVITEQLAGLELEIE